MIESLKSSLKKYSRQCYCAAIIRSRLILTFHPWKCCTIIIIFQDACTVDFDSGDADYLGHGNVDGFYDGFVGQQVVFIVASFDQTFYLTMLNS